MFVLKEILAGIDSAIERATQDSIVSIQATLEERIFNDGLAVNQQKIGTYSPGYKEKRKEKGLQTSFVDLTFTTSLNKSIKANDSQLFFGNQYGKDVSAYNEIRFQKRIFAPTEKEAQIFQDNLNEELTKLFKVK